MPPACRRAARRRSSSGPRRRPGCCRPAHRRGRSRGRRWQATAAAGMATAAAGAVVGGAADKAGVARGRAPDASRSSRSLSRCRVPFRRARRICDNPRLPAFGSPPLPMLRRLLRLPLVLSLLRFALRRAGARPGARPPRQGRGGGASPIRWRCWPLPRPPAAAPHGTRCAAQHSEVQARDAGLQGTVERWSDIATGSSVLRYQHRSARPAPPASTARRCGRRTAATTPKVETGAAALELAANAAYRDRLAFWYPDRARAQIEYKERDDSDGRKYDVVTIAPEGGRPFEFWIDAETKLIERLVEREAEVTRTEMYTDRREVQGVRIPFKVRTTRGDPKFDEVVDGAEARVQRAVDRRLVRPARRAAEIAVPRRPRVGRGALRGDLGPPVRAGDARRPRAVPHAARCGRRQRADARRRRRRPGGRRQAAAEDGLVSTTINGVELERPALPRWPTSIRSCAGSRASTTSAACSGSSGSCACRSGSTTRARASRSTIPRSSSTGSGTKVPVASAAACRRCAGSIDGVRRACSRSTPAAAAR